jgi:hypothetical protein
VAVGDFNGDGRLDLAVANGSFASVLLGNGDGTFQAAQVVQPGIVATSVAVGDFNNDGRLDLALAGNFGTTTVSVLPGNGDGTFQSPQDFSIGSPASALAVADVNGDGRPDLVAANWEVGTVSVLLNELPLSAAAVNFGAIAGAPDNGPVATFTNPYPSADATSYTATIDWGDGNVSSGTITGSGTLTVSGSHTYAEPGSDAITVTIQGQVGFPATATVYPTATVTSLGQAVQDGLTGGIGFWNNNNGQRLIDSFNGGAASTALSGWLATNFGNLYGAGAGANNLTGFSNAQVAAFFQSQFALPGSLEAQVLATALNVYATTLSLGGTVGQAYGFSVSADGLGAYTFNVGSDGAAFGAANNATGNVYALLQGVNDQAVLGVLYGGDKALRNEASDLLGALMKAGSIG